MGTGMPSLKYAVTGGAGFIGSTLVRTLMQQGSVVIIDNLLTGRESNVAEIRSQVASNDRQVGNKDCGRHCARMA